MTKEFPMTNDECLARRFQILCEEHLEPERIAIATRWERFSLSAFCGVGGAKWGEGRGEVPRCTISLALRHSFVIRHSSFVISPTGARP